MSIPSTVRRYVDRAIAAADDVPSRIRIAQAGQMQLKPNGRWLPFVATEAFDIRTIGFAWRAHCRVAPLVGLTVLDEYRDEVGRLEARLWGRVPVMRSSGPDLARGEALRYLGELFWMPYSVVANPELRWRDLGEHAAEVSAPIGTSSVSLRIDFNERDEIAAVSALRPRREGKTTVDTPWRGEVRDYATFGGMWLPRHARVSWELPAGEWTYWEGELTGVEVD